MAMLWASLPLTVIIFQASFAELIPEKQGASVNLTNEERLMKDIFQFPYRKHVRPAPSAHSPVVVSFKAQLMGVAKVDEKEQTIKTQLWIMEKWNNPLFKWNPSDYGGVRTIQVPADFLWTPDIVLLNKENRFSIPTLNSIDDRGSSNQGMNNFKTKVKLWHNGTNVWSAPCIFLSSCAIDVQYFPFDDQNCDLVFASWSHSIDELNLKMEPNALTIIRKSDGSAAFNDNEEWYLLDQSMSRRKVHNEWAGTKVPEIKIKMRMRRRTYYYVMNLILPCTLIACTIFLEFILPAESGERVGLGITILLSMAVFQELTSEKLPSSSEHYPLLAMYYSVSIMEIGTALAATCVILNFYHRKTKMPRWFKKLVLGWLAPLVRFKCTCCRGNQDSQAINEGSTIKMLQAKSSDLKRNDAFDNDRESIEYEMEYSEDISGCLEREQMVQNGGVHPNGTHRKRPSKKMHNKEGSTEMKDHIQTNHNGYDTIQEEIWKKEWQDAARVLDRVLLGVSFFIGTLSAMAIFLQSPRIRELFAP